ncbi:hypothetical protein Goarm_005231 [Gossypium armourianum]|uniref:Uncharacterized protein n=1 Tax=Gossypium armourianum TaxID=34283 RepID=A0A7J9JZD0_9ROSI|nr:hypothetical protein [Gossypium armourianum]
MDREPPPCGWIKFNVAGVSLDERAGYRGVLRDEKGVVSALFQVQLPLIIELDLNTVLNWLKYRNLRPLSLRKLFAEIEDGCRHIAKIQMDDAGMVCYFLQQNTTGKSVVKVFLSAY